MEITELINHPEQMERDTLYELRSMLALHPYFQTARLLMLQNLYLLHDPTFDEELRKAALYVTDRKVIFKMIEAGHYQLNNAEQKQGVKKEERQKDNRTFTLIDNFLDSIPQEDEDKTQPKRHPTPADAAIDYVAYLMESENYATDNHAEDDEAGEHSRTVDLIDTFLEQEQGRILLSDIPQEPESNNDSDDTEDSDEEYFTETLARIYIKQGRYQKALDIITRLSQRLPKKNAYFADQIRFLEKLIINNKNKNQK